MDSSDSIAMDYIVIRAGKALDRSERFLIKKRGCNGELSQCLFGRNKRFDTIPVVTERKEALYSP
jgi:hypothetical protein